MLQVIRIVCSPLFVRNLCQGRGEGVTSGTVPLINPRTVPSHVHRASCVLQQRTSTCAPVRNEVLRTLGGGALTCVSCGRATIRAGASALQDFFFSDEHLEYLDISGNPLADQGAHHIATLLQMNARIHSLSLARCSITEGVCKEFEIAMRNNTTLTSLNFSENDVRDMRIRYVLESTNSNVDLIHVRDHPLKYDFEAQSTVTKRQLISKIHHLDEPKLRLLVSNTSFMNDPNMKRRLLELVPPTRRKLVFSGQAMAKTAGADWRHVRAARFIQRRYREYKSGKSLKYSMADVVEAKVRAYKKQFYGTYGKQGWAKEKLRRAARKAAMVHKLGQVGEGAKGGDLAKAVVLRSSAQVAPS